MSDTKYKFLDKSVLYAIEVSKSSSAGRLVFKRRFGINMGSSLVQQIYLKTLSEYLKLAKHKLWLLQPRLWKIFLHGLPMICKVPAQKFHIITCSTAHAVLNGVAWLRSGMADKFWLVVVKRH
jgi:hypothetical protein